ncbi:PLD phosphodiesterase domain-containing protein [Candidatus Hydrogenisulfobacillus filiaventi]|uniref:phospholipase D n=1 Tax=Candidatus Hydrogenisulfobacillus filiaventi TaxID=2707344 RepID=A0A6F8ZFG7_9FIRM|nr:phospholipase D-like domain-containing protein [Bacillota bacterium]CAB1128444.1 PLD phosphodiesterase domain-containing protein [Candidatus Hydrogenisulfobacillus filiaventi]
MGITVELGIRTWFSPEDDTQTVFLDFLRQAQHSLRLAVYSFHLPVAVDILSQQLRAGVNVALVLDHSQAERALELPEIRQLLATGAEVTVGTSRLHAIMHHKFAVADGMRVLTGSWNFTLSASREDNFIQVTSNPEYARLFLDKWQAMRAWMRTHEPQWQPPAGP